MEVGGRWGRGYEAWEGMGSGFFVSIASGGSRGYLFLDACNARSFKNSADDLVLTTMCAYVNILDLGANVCPFCVSMSTYIHLSHPPNSLHPPKLLSPTPPTPASGFP